MHGAGGGEYTLSPPRYHRNRNCKMTPAKKLAAALDRMPRFRCAHLPTPLEPMHRLREALCGEDGPKLWIKRDDCTGLATGGNKARKLEYLVGAAQKNGADILLTHGALQSNHVRQTAAAAALAGMECKALYEHRVEDADADYQNSGNALLTQLLGATRDDFAKGEDMDAALETAAEKLRAAGRRPYVIPGGGSNPVGASGYVHCALELSQQAEQAGIRVSHVVHATGSAGTQAGLVAGCRALGSPFAVLGIGVNAPQNEQEEKVFKLACATLAHLGIDGELPRDAVRANCEYIGAGYGLPTDGMLEAVSLLARTEGILLDPVYAGKGMAGLIGLIRAGEFSADDNVVFVHTGGAAALFAYRAALAGIGAG